MNVHPVYFLKYQTNICCQLLLIICFLLVLYSSYSLNHWAYCFRGRRIWSGTNVSLLKSEFQTNFLSALWDNSFKSQALMRVDSFYIPRAKCDGLKIVLHYQTLCREDGWYQHKGSFFHSGNWKLFWCSEELGDIWEIMCLGLRCWPQILGHKKCWYCLSCL